MIPAIETKVLIWGVVFVDVLKIAVSVAMSGTFAGVQFAALFQLLFAGAAFHACWARPGIRTKPHNAAIDVASIFAGRAAGMRGVARFVFVGTLWERFIRVFGGW